MIQIHTISFSYPDSAVTLFDNFSAVIGAADGYRKGSWTCIAGANGCGKTTLLHLIEGTLMPSAGSISSAAAVYCAQNCNTLPENAYVSFWDADNDIRRFFSMMGIRDEQFNRWETLSGGEKKRIQIACALAERPPVLLLDEPTNHLDAASKEQLLQALTLYEGTGVIVSHDRAFSDELCTSTLYLYRPAVSFSGGADCVQCTSYPGGLSRALSLREEETGAARAEWQKNNDAAAKAKSLSDKWQREAEHSANRLRKSLAVKKGDHDAAARIDAARISGKDKTAGDTGKRFATRLAQTEAKRDSVAKPLSRKKGFSIDVQETNSYVPETLLTLEAQTLSPGGGTEGKAYSLEIPELRIRRKSRIALTGENGAGKTMLVRKITDTLSDRPYFCLPQEVSEEDSIRTIERFESLEDALRGQVLSTVYRMGSEPDQIPSGQHSDRNQISPGELRKLMIAMAVCGCTETGRTGLPLQLLLLDEPTNHMDIISTQSLESALNAVECALLIISHDKVFLENTGCNEKWHITRSGNKGTLELV
jgi:macrolide transport system ATP-binding/permease protein